MLSCTIAKCKTIGAQSSTKFLKVFFDSGSTKTIIHQSVLPPKYQNVPNTQLAKFQTLGGKATSTTAVLFTEISFPEFNSNISVEKQLAYTFEPTFSKSMVSPSIMIKILQLVEHKISLIYPGFFGKTLLADLNDNLCQTKEQETLDRNIFDNSAARILDRKYKQVNTKTIVAKQIQLNPNKYNDIQHILAII